MKFKYLQFNNNIIKKNKFNLFIPMLFGFKHNKLIKTFYYENMYYKIFYLIFNHISLLDVFFKKKKIFYNFIQYFQINLYVYLIKKSNTILLDLIFYFFYLLFITFENFQNYNYNNLILKGYKLRQQYRTSLKFKNWLKPKTFKYHYFNYINSISLYILNYNIYKNFYLSKFNLFLSKSLFIYKLFYYFKLLQYKMQSFSILYKQHFKIEKNLRVFFAKNSYLISKFLNKKLFYWFYRYKLNLLKLKSKKNLNKIIYNNNIKSKIIRIIKKQKVLSNTKKSGYKINNNKFITIDNEKEKILLLERKKLIKEIENKFNITFCEESYNAFIKINFFKNDFNYFVKLINDINYLVNSTNFFKNIFWYIFYFYIGFYNWNKKLIKKKNLDLFVLKLKAFFSVQFYNLILINFNLDIKYDNDIIIFISSILKLDKILILMYDSYSNFKSLISNFKFISNNFYKNYENELFIRGNINLFNNIRKEKLINYNNFENKNINILKKKLRNIVVFCYYYKNYFLKKKKIKLIKSVGINIPKNLMIKKCELYVNNINIFFKKYDSKFKFKQIYRYIKYNKSLKKWIQLKSSNKKKYILNLLSKKLKKNKLKIRINKRKKKKKNLNKYLNFKFNKLDKLFILKNKFNIKLKNKITYNNLLKKNIFFNKLLKLSTIDSYYKQKNIFCNKLILNKKKKAYYNYIKILNFFKFEFNQNLKNEFYYLCISNFEQIKMINNKIKFLMNFKKFKSNSLNLRKSFIKIINKKKFKRNNFLKFFPMKGKYNFNIKNKRFKFNKKKQNNKFIYSKFYRFYNKFKRLNLFLRKLFRYIQNSKYNKYLNLKFINYGKLRSHRTLKKFFINQFRYNFQLFNPKFFKNKKCQKKFFYNLFIKKKIKTKYFKGFKNKNFKKIFFETYYNFKKTLLRKKKRNKSKPRKKDKNIKYLLLSCKLKNDKSKNNIDFKISKKILFLRKYKFFNILNKIKNKKKLYYSKLYSFRKKNLLKYNELQYFYNYLVLKKQNLIKQFKILRNKFLILIKLNNKFKNNIYYKFNLIKLKKKFKLKLIFLNNKLLFIFNLIKKMNKNINYKFNFINLKELKFIINNNLYSNKTKFIKKPIFKKGVIKKNSFNKFFYLKKLKFKRPKYLVSLNFLNSQLGLQYKKFIRSNQFRRLKSFKNYYKNYLKLKQRNPYRFYKLRLNHYMKSMAYRRFKRSNFFFFKKKKIRSFHNKNNKLIKLNSYNIRNLGFKKIKINNKIKYNINLIKTHKFKINNLIYINIFEKKKKILRNLIKKKIKINNIIKLNKYNFNTKRLIFLKKRKKKIYKLKIKKLKIKKLKIKKLEIKKLELTKLRIKKLKLKNAKLKQKRLKIKKLKLKLELIRKKKRKRTNNIKKKKFVNKKIITKIRKPYFFLFKKKYELTYFRNKRRTRAQRKFLIKADKIHKFLLNSKKLKKRNFNNYLFYFKNILKIKLKLLKKKTLFKVFFLKKINKNFKDILFKNQLYYNKLIKFSFNSLNFYNEYRLWIYNFKNFKKIPYKLLKLYSKFYYHKLINNLKLNSSFTNFYNNYLGARSYLRNYNFKFFFKRKKSLKKLNAIFYISFKKYMNYFISSKNVIFSFMKNSRVYMYYKKHEMFKRKFNDNTNIYLFLTNLSKRRSFYVSKYTYYSNFFYIYWAKFVYGYKFYGDYKKKFDEFFLFNYYFKCFKEKHFFFNYLINFCFLYVQKINLNILNYTFIFNNYKTKLIIPLEKFYKYFILFHFKRKYYNFNNNLLHYNFKGILPYYFSFFSTFFKQLSLELINWFNLLNNAQYNGYQSSLLFNSCFILHNTNALYFHHRYKYLYYYRVYNYYIFYIFYYLYNHLFKVFVRLKLKNFKLTYDLVKYNEYNRYYLGLRTRILILTIRNRYKRGFTIEKIFKNIKFFLRESLKKKELAGYYISIRGRYKRSSRSNKLIIKKGVYSFNKIDLKIDSSYGTLNTRYGIAGIKVIFAFK